MSPPRPPTRPPRRTPLSPSAISPPSVPRIWRPKSPPLAARYPEPDGSAPGCAGGTDACEGGGRCAQGEAAQELTTRQEAVEAHAAALFA